MYVGVVSFFFPPYLPESEVTGVDACHATLLMYECNVKKTGFIKMNITVGEEVLFK